MENVGIVGWRGMVGSVLLERMRAEGDFAGLTTTFYSTSQVGEDGPDLSQGGGSGSLPLGDAYDVSALSKHQVVLTCQGGDYTKQVLPQLREQGWNGFWIDAASAKRMDEDSIIVLDPLNRDLIDQGIAEGYKNFVGGNCTVSLMLLALHGLFREDLVEWMTCMTYQAASGGGARHMRELVSQMGTLHAGAAELLADPATNIIPVDTQVTETLRSDAMPTENFGAPLAASLLPWIDSAQPFGDTREEWKAFAEGNKILGRPADAQIPIDSICVRVGAMRCHSQAFTIKLRTDVPLDEIEPMLDEANEWVRLVPNDKESTLAQLTPTAVTGTLDIPVGRVRKMRLGDHYLAAFTVGDQLLWGAAEPLRRILAILRESGV
ncbi:MAG: aspartate-semialdehyde dehydrogenase [bacterium]|nr:aspartate-semialdehyde dehydrogenase [bacterium]